MVVPFFLCNSFIPLKTEKKVQNSACGEKLLLSCDGAEGQETNTALF